MDQTVKLELNDLKLPCCCGAPVSFPKVKCDQCNQTQVLLHSNDISNDSLSISTFENKKYNKQFTPVVHSKMQPKKFNDEEIIIKRFQCGFCDESFTCKVNVYEHFERHLQKKPFQCNYCKQNFAMQINLNLHLRRHSKETEIITKLSSNHCTSLKTRPHVNQEIKWYTRGKQVHKCDICSKIFKEKHYLKRHEKTHIKDRPFRCSMCDRSFFRKSNLEMHERTHTGEKPFQCCVCEKRFARKCVLRNHVMVHTGEKSFQCYMCEKAFSAKSNLKEHERVHTGEKPFQCNVCQRHFGHKNNFKRHLLTHTEDKPYKCNLCEKAYTQKHVLIHHITVNHTHCECQMCMNSTKIKLEEQSELEDISISNLLPNPQPYKCQICSTLFNKKCTLIKHIVLHKTEKNEHVCSICNKSFICSKYLKKHCKIHMKRKQF